MTRIPSELTKNFADPAVRRKLMAEYAGCRGFQGRNENGEIVWVSINSDEITVATYQNNGWVRFNYYDENGLASGEAFNGKWNKPDESEEKIYIVVQNWFDECRVETIPYKTKKAAIGAYRNLLEAVKRDDPVEEIVDQYFYCEGMLVCEIQEKVICDA